MKQREYCGSQLSLFGPEKPIFNSFYDGVAKTGHKNVNLNLSKKADYDEFYTLYETVENELVHYKDFLFGKNIYCPCDDPFLSNFTRYFLDHFNTLGLKRLISTSYSGIKENHQGNLFDDSVMPFNGHILDVNCVPAGVNIDDFILENTTDLDGNGDFSSTECIKFMEEADVIVTNPAFSKANDFFELLFQKGKDFIVLGNFHMAKYKNMLPRIVRKEVHIGVTSGTELFKIPKDMETGDRKNIVVKNGKRYSRFDNIIWYTTFDHGVYHDPIPLVSMYMEEMYPKYDDYEAIDVPGYNQIPCDYNGIMGVPLTILKIINPKQFRIVGEFNHGQDNEFDFCKPVVDGKELFPRIAIQRVS